MDVTGGYGGACAVGCAILALAVVTVPVDEQPRSPPVLGPVAGGR